MKDAFMNTSAGSVINDMDNSKWTFLTCVVLSLLFSFGYVKFMDWCAFHLAWASVIIVQISLIGIGVFCYHYKSDLVEQGQAEMA